MAMFHAGVLLASLWLPAAGYGLQYAEKARSAIFDNAEQEHKQGALFETQGIAGIFKMEALVLSCRYFSWIFTKGWTDINHMLTARAAMQDPFSKESVGSHILTFWSVHKTMYNVLLNSQDSVCDRQIQKWSSFMSRLTRGVGGSARVVTLVTDFIWCVWYLPAFHVQRQRSTLFGVPWDQVRRWLEILLPQTECFRVTSNILTRALADPSVVTKTTKTHTATPPPPPPPP
jgi:hypothetical protein